MKRISEMVAVGEHPVLFRQIGPAAIHQIKAGHTVLFGDLLRAQVFFHCLVEKAAALDGSIIGDDNHMLALHKADTGNDSGRGDLIVILAPGGKWRQFQKGRARVDQSVDPAVADAAAIAAKHEKWDERPVLLVVKAPDAEITEANIIAFFEEKIAKWQIPDKVIFVEELPRNATGKVLKNKLREEYGSILMY